MDRVRGRLAILVALASGFIVAAVVTAGAQSSGGTGANSDVAPPSEKVPTTECESGSMVGETILDYVLPPKGATKDAKAGLNEYLLSHGYALDSSDFVFGEISDQASSTWAVPADSSDTPDAVAVLGEIAEDYWVVEAFSACDAFDKQNMTEEVSP